jgi:hypothetical protein
MVGIWLKTVLVLPGDSTGTLVRKAIPRQCIGNAQAIQGHTQAISLQFGTELLVSTNYG